jgi:serine/threonine protein phosphatase 1
MSGRLLAIGDIHGCLTALNALLAQINPRPEDTVVALGDYVDRGPDSRGAIDRLLSLQKHCSLVPLLGNHDQMLLMIVDGQDDILDDWLSFGGDATLASYGGAAPAAIPREHLDFLRSCRMYYETERYFFVHGSYMADVPLDQQDANVLLWDSLKRRLPGPHCSGKTAIVGHTSQKNGEVLDLGYLKCVDTFVYGTGWLTGMDVETGRIWQVDQRGRMKDKISMPGPVN